MVSLTNTGAGSATVSVRASNYTVVVAAWAPCWTVVHSPQSFSPVFAGTLQAGQVKDFNPANGQLTLSMSASLVTVQVKINGKTVPKWLFKPSIGPLHPQLQLDRDPEAGPFGGFDGARRIRRGG